jgi:hypothetical protein
VAEADLYTRAGTAYMEAWTKMSREISPPHYPPSFEGFSYLLKKARAKQTRTTPQSLADDLIAAEKKKR